MLWSMNEAPTMPIANHKHARGKDVAVALCCEVRMWSIKNKPYKVVWMPLIEWRPALIKGEEM